MTPRLHCILSEHHDLSLLPALAEAGVDAFQVRAKSLDTGSLVELTREVVAAVAPYHTAVIVNDRVDVALAARATGAHLGADDLSVADARQLAPELLIGATCRTRADVSRAAAEGADYAGFGPVFTTDSKSGLPAALGPEALTRAAGVLPLIAIAGITAESTREVRAAGAHGVAVIGAIWRDPDPVSAAKELVAAIGG